MSEDGEREKSESNDGRHERQFHFGGLTVELSGVSADIEEARVGLEPIELDSSTAESGDGSSERDERRNRRSTGRSNAGYGARLGAFLGREIGLFLGRILDRGVRVLWNRFRARRGKNGTEGRSAETEGSTDDSAEFDGELLARLARVTNRDGME
ncbi:hypothetical protein [Haladaptatus sp. AB643]|uniref:hypothetical protein n=1 Tax=Haladaptatus sp. AB643 TaxID=2934174 RepID=UPI00209BF7C4|nr:hypothetical protein [Haladaptatus sp. AB643]MCO8246451.1 hypothetical protein [Haladaptatus sp. AB643]